MGALAIAAAIAFAASHPVNRATEYAEILSHDPEPLLLVALVQHESGWRAGSIGGLDKQCIGLGQRCLRYSPKCRDGYDAPACQAERARLLDGGNALREILFEARAWRKLCGTRWLLGYAGFGSKRHPCGPKRTPRLILDVQKIERSLRER